MRDLRWISVAFVLGVGGAAAACQDNAPASGSSSSAAATSASSVSASVAPSAAAASSATTVSDAAVEKTPSAADLAEEDDKLAFEVQTEHRHHHVGFAGFVMMAVDTLGTSTDQDDKLAKIRAEFNAKVKPIHEANAAVSAALADGVAAGAIDKAKVDAALARSVAASTNAHSAVDEELTQLHDALRPEQRAALVDKVSAQWSLWKQANGPNEPVAHAKHQGHLERFAKKIDLTDEQVTKLRTALEGAKEAKPAFDPAAADKHMSAFSDAFVAEKFDAKKVAEASAESSRVIGWGETRMVRFYEAALPILTPEQRTKVAAELREHANETQPEGTP